MLFDFRSLSASDRSRLLTSTVLPRPIALVTSLDADGRVNAAPFSYFNVMSSDPPLLALGVERRGSGIKDTAANIRATGHFTVNLVTEELAAAMTICAIDFPPGVDELAAAGLATHPGHLTPVPRIARSPASFECRLAGEVAIGGAAILVGEVLALHLDDAFYDADRGSVRGNALGLIGRMHRGGWYVRTTDLFDMPRLSLSEFEAGLMPKIRTDV